MIKISNLTNRKGKNNYIFSDLHLDFTPNQVTKNSVNNDIVVGNDIASDVDQKAIMNSIRNIISQRRYLDSAFGVNIRKYIGEPVSDLIGMAIGDAIDKGITLYEPRVSLTKLLVAPDYDKNTYHIFIFLTTPNFPNNDISLIGILDKTGEFNYINKG